LVCLPLIGGGETTLRASYLSAPWQIYEPIYLLLRVQECRLVSPSQGAGLMVLSMGDGILTHSSVPKVPRPNSSFKELAYFFFLLFKDSL
jgi:hypothetical protein